MKDEIFIPGTGIVIAQSMKPETTVCMCCGKTIPINPLYKQPLCNKCYLVAVEMLFSGIYDDLTAKEFRNAVRNKVLEARNE
jgi:hypothetical protein